MTVSFEPSVWRGKVRIPRDTIVLRPAEVERAWRQMLTTFPALVRTWQRGAFAADVDAMARFYEGMRRLLGS